MSPLLQDPANKSIHGDDIHNCIRYVMKQQYISAVTISLLPPLPNIFRHSRFKLCVMTAVGNGKGL